MTFYFSSAYEKIYLFQTFLLSGSLKEGFRLWSNVCMIKKDYTLCFKNNSDEFQVPRTKPKLERYMSPCEQRSFTIALERKRSNSGKKWKKGWVGGDCKTHIHLSLLIPAIG